MTWNRERGHFGPVALFLVVAGVCFLAAAARAQWTLVLMPETARVTAVGSRAFGDRDFDPLSVGLRRQWLLDMPVPGGFPAVVHDGEGVAAAGFAADIPTQRTWGLIWPGDGSVVVCASEGWRHAMVLGTNGETFVGRVARVGAVHAAMWGVSGELEDLHRPEWSESVAEDITPGGLIAVAADNDAWVLTADRVASKLPRPAWATVQAWPHAATDRGLVVGEASSLSKSRPVAWRDGVVAELADRYGVCLDVNGSGLAVGWLGEGLGSVGVAWFDAPASGEWVDLNGLAGESGVSIIAAYDVSEHGDIAVGCVTAGGEGIGGVLVRRSPERSR